MVEIKIDTSTFATLIAGLYSAFKGVDVIAIPSYFWLALATSLEPHMEDWKYDVQSFEEWIDSYLIITIKEVLSEEEIEELKSYSVYIEVGNGNATLIGAGDLVWDSTNI